MFNQPVILVEPIFQKVDSALSSLTLFDTSDIKACVTENNLKYVNRIIKQLTVSKNPNDLDDSYNPYKTTYDSIPSHAASNQTIQQMDI